MAFSWSRVADLTQRSVSIGLFGLTLVSLGVLSKGGYDSVQRRKMRKATESAEQNSTSATESSQQQQVEFLNMVLLRVILLISQVSNSNSAPHQ